MSMDELIYDNRTILAKADLALSIERGALGQTIMQMMGEQISTDMDEIVVRGDRASADETCRRSTACSSKPPRTSWTAAAIPPTAGSSAT